LAVPGFVVVVTPCSVVLGDETCVFGWLVVDPTAGRAVPPTAGAAVLPPPQAVKANPHARSTDPVAPMTRRPALGCETVMSIV